MEGAGGSVQDFADGPRLDSGGIGRGGGGVDRRQGAGTGWQSATEGPRDALHPRQRSRFPAECSAETSHERGVWSCREHSNTATPVSQAEVTWVCTEVRGGEVRGRAVREQSGDGLRGSGGHTRCPIRIGFVFATSATFLLLRPLLSGGGGWG